MIYSWQSCLTFKNSKICSCQQKSIALNKQDWTCFSLWRCKKGVINLGIIQIYYSVPQLLTFDHELASPCWKCFTSPFLSQLILKRKPYNLLSERNFETARFFTMQGYRKVLVEMVLFHVISTKNCQEPSMAKNIPISKLLFNNG